MTKIKDIRVFDECDRQYEVSEIDFDIEKEEAYVYIKSFGSLEEILLNDACNVEKRVKGLLTSNNIPCDKVYYVDDSNILLLKFQQHVATINVANVLEFDEHAITPEYNGWAAINLEMIL